MITQCVINLLFSYKYKIDRPMITPCVINLLFSYKYKLDRPMITQCVINLLFSYKYKIDRPMITQCVINLLWSYKYKMNRQMRDKRIMGIRFHKWAKSINKKNAEHFLRPKISDPNFSWVESVFSSGWIRICKGDKKKRSKRQT